MSNAMIIPRGTAAAPAPSQWLTLFARSDRGRVRPTNQDSFLVADLTAGASGLADEVRSHPVGGRGSLLAVSDGTGAGEAGEIASAVVLASLHEALADPASCGGAAGACGGTVEHLRRALRRTGVRAWEFARRNRHLRGFGATLTAVLVRDGAAHVAHVGDSRAYRIRGDRIRVLTRDQTLAQSLIDSGSMAPGAPQSTPHVLLHSFGPRPAVEFELTTVEVEPGDHLLVCSDGLTNKVTPVELHRVACEAPGPDEACRRLVHLANERGGEDNVTVVLARVSAGA